MKLLIISSLCFVCLLATAQDTIYVSNQAKSYLLFDEPVTLADVGNPSLYQAQIEGNSVLVVASKDSVADTPFYAVVGGKPFTARLLFHPHPEAFYDFRTEGKQFETTDAGESARQTLERLQQLASYHDLNYAAARKNGIRFRLVGLVHDLSTTYLKFKVVNRTSLPYQTDFVGFERLKRYKKGFFAKDKEARFPAGTGCPMAGRRSASTPDTTVLRELPVLRPADAITGAKGSHYRYASREWQQS